jgi:AraC-like DNA-binding protein
MFEWKESIQEMVDWIEENIEEEPTLIKMSNVISYSPCYCSYLFHQVTGMTLKQYISGRKLYYAAIDLRDSRQRIIDIAVKYGYSSQEALTRAFSQAYGCTPYKYRKNPVPIKLSIKQNILTPEDYIDIGGLTMSNVKEAQMRFEYIPAHKYIGVWDENSTGYWDFFEKHNCDEITGVVESMRNVAHDIIGCHVAGWFYKNGVKGYFYGLGVSADFKGEIPKGFEVREMPGSMYMKFFHPMFHYLTENNEVVRRVEDLAWKFDPSSVGYQWNEEECQDYQIHLPEVVGYEVFRPVKKIEL